MLDSKFRQHKALRSGRKLLASPNAISFAPLVDASRLEEEDGYVISNEDTFADELSKFTWGRPDLYHVVLSVIQSISSIRRNRRRRIAAKSDSRGAALQALEDSIANLDQRQSKALIETVNGVQRLRGLAGSGKTIILALKAAYTGGNGEAGEHGKPSGHGAALSQKRVRQFRDKDKFRPLI